MGRKKYTKISKIKDSVDNLKHEVITKRRMIRSYLNRIESYDFTNEPYEEFVVLVDNCYEALMEMDTLTQLLTAMRKYYLELLNEFEDIYMRKMIEYKELQLKERTNNFTDVMPLLRIINDKKFGLIMDAIKRRLPIVVYDSGIASKQLFQAVVMLLKNATFVLDKYEFYVPKGNKKVLIDKSNPDYKSKVRKEIGLDDNYVVFESVETPSDKELVESLVESGRPVIVLSKEKLSFVKVEYNVNNVKIGTTKELNEVYDTAQIIARDYESLHNALVKVVE